MGVGKRGAGQTEPPFSPASLPSPPHLAGGCQHTSSPAGHIWRLPALVSAASRLPPAWLEAVCASKALNIQRDCQDQQAPSVAGRGGTGWDAEPRYEPLRPAKPRQLSKGISERRAEQAPVGRTPAHSQRLQGDTQSPGAQRWRHEWPGERSPALCGFSASWVAC